MSPLGMYAAGAIAFIFWGVVMTVYRTPLEMRIGARIILAAPVWPLALAALAAWLLYRLVRWLIRGVHTLFLIAFNKHPEWKKY